MRRARVLGWLAATLAAACGEPGGGMDAGRVITRDTGGVECAELRSRGPYERCACPADCVGERGFQCQLERTDGFPGGACVRECDTEVPDDCGAGAICTAGSGVGSVGVCRPSCTEADDCAPGRVCDGEGCFLLCQSDDECELGPCDRYTGLCRPTDDGLGVNRLCSTNDECRSGFCSADGRCSSLCSLSRQGCPEDGVCVPALGIRGDLGVCATRCMVDADCTDGLVCRTTMTATATVRICALP